MKKVVGIIGSPKPLVQSITHSLANDFINELKKQDGNIESESIYLLDKNISPCKGCLACQQLGKCVIDDDMNMINRHMREADILIFGSPVHFGHVSSIFQRFIERSLISLHTFEYLGTPFVNVVTTNGSGEEEADKFLAKIGYLFGGIKIGSILKSNNDAFKEKGYRAIIQKTSSILAGDQIRPKLMNQLYFSSMKDVIKKNRDYFKAEAEIWDRKGWFNKSYKEIYNELRKGN